MSRGASIRWTYLERALQAIVVEGECWLWPSVNGRGYGYFGKERAHRVVYELIVGPIPPGLVLDHGCQNTRCVNPAHMEPVTQAVNSQRRCDAKITAEIADEIRSSPLGAARLARRHGITMGMVWRIRKGLSWAS